MKGVSARGRFGRVLALGLVALALVCVMALPGFALTLPAGSKLFKGPSAATPAQFFVPYYNAPRQYRAPRVYRKRKRTYRRKRVTKPKCAHPWTYSQGLRKCICVLEGYGRSGDKCVKLAQMCSANGQWSAADKKCLCNDGFVLKDGHCQDPQLAAAPPPPPAGAWCLWPRVPDDKGKICDCAPGYREEGGACLSETKGVDNRSAQPDRGDGILTTEVALIQQCLKESGYLRGAIATRMTKRAWTAYWYFKQDYKVGSTPKGVHDAGAQGQLFDLCPLAARAVNGILSASYGQSPGAAPLLPGATTPNPENSEPQPPVKKVYAKPEANCLPDHLYGLIVKSYGKRSGLKRCSKTCVAIPKGLSNREILRMEKRGIRWCRACLELNSHLSLEDILRIERGADVQICTRPPTRLPRWQRADGAPRVAYTKVRQLYRTLPTATDRGADIAVVIGNKNYQGGLPANESAHNNAGAMYALLSEHLGFAQENIIDLRDATMEDLVHVFGDGGDRPGELVKRLEGRPDASVLIYFAGHGSTSLDQRESYLLPVDAVKHREGRSAFPMSRLYAGIARLGVKTVMLLLEAGFGRDQSDFVFAPNLPVMDVRSLPPQPVKGLTVITAAEKDQRTMDDAEYGIGLFTRYLIEGLAGRADLEPIGNNDLKIDSVELYAYTAHMVDLAARKSYGMLQKPVMSGRDNSPVSGVQAQLQ